MATSLPALSYKELQATRDYLQDVAKVLGKLQQVFLPPEAHDWHRGLEVNADSLVTQPFELHGQTTEVMLDMQHGYVQLADHRWELDETPARELFSQLQTWLAEQGLAAMSEPEFVTSTVQFDRVVAANLAAALDWMSQQFAALKLPPDGLVSPILLFPHHFDLSLVWFPKADERQVSLGFSTGDDDIPEPYLYVTIYPETAGFDQLSLPPAAHWQSEGFKGAVLTYAKLQANSQPEVKLANFVALLTEAGRLFG